MLGSGVEEEFSRGFRRGYWAAGGDSGSTDDDYDGEEEEGEYDSEEFDAKFRAGYEAAQEEYRRTHPVQQMGMASPTSGGRRANLQPGTLQCYLSPGILTGQC
jgi:hypothetical protein